MAYTPDGTFERLGQISRKAGQLYLYFCQWRDHRTGYSRKNFDTGCTELGLSRATVYRVRNELVEGDWISLDTSGRVGLRGGNFSRMDKTPSATLVWQDWKDPYSADAREPGHELGTDCVTGLSVETTRLNSETENLNPETKNLNVETAHIKERARGSSSRLSSNSSSIPAAARARLREGSERTGTAAAAVAVGSENIACDEPYVAAVKASGAYPSPYVDFVWKKLFEHCAKKTQRQGYPVLPTRGQFDWWLKHENTPVQPALPAMGATVHDIHQRRSEERAAVEQQLVPFETAAESVDLMSRVPDYDVAGYIEQMQNISEETRAKLREKFIAAPAAEVRTA